MAEEPELGIRHDDKGIHAIGPLDDGERVRVVVREEWLDNTDEPTVRDLSEALIVVRGTDDGLHSATWIARFTDMTRQAAFYGNGACCWPPARCACSPCCMTPGRCASSSVSPGGLDITPWADRFRLIDAEHVGTWERPVLGGRGAA